MGWRALRSTVVIGVVAVVVSAVRSGDLRWEAIVRMAGSYRTLLVIVFLGLLVWEGWSLWVKRRRVGGDLKF